MAEEKVDQIDRILKIAGFLVLLISGLWTFFRYIDDQREAATKSEQSRRDELSTAVFQKQEQLFFEAASVASVIARSSDTKAVAKAKERFNELYSGELVIVEDRRVELAMIAFFHCFDDHNKPCQRAEVDQFGELLPAAIVHPSGDDELAFSVADISLDLAACIRSALQKNRGISFGKVQPTNTVCPYEGSPPPEPVKRVSWFKRLVSLGRD